MSDLTEIRRRVVLFLFASAKRPILGFVAGRCGMKAPGLKSGRYGLES